MKKDKPFVRCAELIGQAEGLLITAGAGMGMDAGLPDFSGPSGFWRVYPAGNAEGVALKMGAVDALREIDKRLPTGTVKKSHHFEQ